MKCDICHDDSIFRAMDVSVMPGHLIGTLTHILGSDLGIVPDGTY